MSNLLDKLAENAGLTNSQVISVLNNAPAKYKVYSIPKRTSGYRIIAHPEKRLKSLQRVFLGFSNFPIHQNAMAYVAGKGIKPNALAHSKNSYLLKMDFANFFGSITPELFWDCWEKRWNIPELEEQLWLTRLLFWKGTEKSDGLKLSIGAPTSPMISNFCMLQFDETVTEICKEQSITYTRYADDITFSTNVKGILFDIPKIIKDTLLNLYSGRIALNYSKTKFSSKAHNRHVTGITITNQGNISIGRERKRYIKHLIHQFTLDKLSSEEVFHLKGLLSFSEDVEPTFIQSVMQKYGAELIQRIRSHD